MSTEHNHELVNFLIEKGKQGTELSVLSYAVGAVAGHDMKNGEVPSPNALFNLLNGAISKKMCAEACLLYGQFRGAPNRVTSA